MSFFSDLSKHLVLPVHRPALFFHNRENVDLKDMSVLELMSVLDQSSWTKSEEVKAIRKLEPYDCTTKLPKVYFVKEGGIPFKPYLLSLLTLTHGKVYHGQCKAYYQCLLSSSLEPTATCQPHQCAQFYKALMGRRTRYQSHTKEKELEVEPDDMFAAAASAFAQTSTKAEVRVKTNNTQRPPAWRSKTVDKKVCENKAPAWTHDNGGQADQDQFSSDSGNENPFNDEIYQDFNDADSGGDSDDSNDSNDHDTQDSLELAAGEIGDTAMLEVDVDACDLGQPSAKRIKTTDESADQTCGNMEVVVEDRDAIEIQPAQPAPAPVPILPAPAEVPEAAAAAERVPTPTFIPKVNSDGHKAICTVLLPVLLCVLCEDQWRNRDSRAQVREACWRALTGGSPWSYRR